MKVIYPHGEIDEASAKEILDFAIENRKRVKQQLQKMDETFEEVDFSYTVKSTGETVTIETLEILELQIPQQSKTERADKSEVNETNERQTDAKPLELVGGQKLIRDNQTGVSYDYLFGEYLNDAKDIKVIDPYVRLPYQLRNFMEFAKLVSEKKNPEVEVKLHLVTANNEEYIEGAKEAFQQMAFSLETIGVIFSYEFDDDIHDRSIILNNGWKVVLGRGLDIWQKIGGWYDINEYLQEKRLCKACEVTFVKE